MPAKAAVSRPPKAIDANLDPWKLASDKPEVKRPSGGELPPGSPSLLMPEPSKPLPAGRHDDRASDPPSRYGAPKRGDEGGFASAGDGLGRPRCRLRALPAARTAAVTIAKAAPPPDAACASDRVRTPVRGPAGAGDARLGARGRRRRRDPPSPRYGGDEPPAFRDPPPPSYRSGRSYTVAEGDTLFNIARYELGKASRWVEIYELNRDVLGKDFNYLTPGMKLVLPEGDRPDVIAQPPSGTYRR